MKKKKTKSSIKKENKNTNKLKNNKALLNREDTNLENQLDFAFKLLFIISLVINAVVIFNSKYICGDVSFTKCGVSYIVYNSQSFFIFMWIENVLAIVAGLYNVIFGGIDKNIKKVIIGILSILIQPIIWVNILIFLNISW